MMKPSREIHLFADLHETSYRLTASTLARLEKRQKDSVKEALKELGRMLSELDYRKF